MHRNYSPPAPKKSSQDLQKSVPPHPNQKFIDEDKADAKRTRRWLVGEDMSNEKKWIVNDNTKNLRIPTAWYAIEVLAPQNGIKKLDEHLYLTTFMGHDGQPFPWYYAVVKVGKGFGPLATSRQGAGGWVDPTIALKFAERNAIRQVLPQETLAYSITRKSLADAKREAIRRYV